jgi:hypothetical protein
LPKKNTFQYSWAPDCCNRELILPFY